MSTIIARSLANLQVEIKANNHTLLADEPILAGGQDLGPNPYDLLLSALAACKIMTVQMYAQRKGWIVESVNLSISHQKVYAKDCADCETEGSAKVDIIDCTIHFEGPLDETQRLRLAQIADRCPVHRSLTSETKIHTTLV